MPDVSPSWTQERLNQQSIRVEFMIIGLRVMLIMELNKLMDLSIRYQVSLYEYLPKSPRVKQDLLIIFRAVIFYYSIPTCGQFA